MAVIVRHKEIGSEYVLLGAGFGAYKALRPSVFLGNLAPHQEAGELAMALICGSGGEPMWVQSDQLEVVSIDGRTPAEILA